MFQINSYLSIHTAYTSPQLHNKLSIIQKSKIQEILLDTSTSEWLQIPLETVQNWRKTLEEWRGRPEKAQPELEASISLIKPE